MFGFHKKAQAAATLKVQTFEVHAAFVGRTPRTAYVTAVNEADAFACVMADPGKWLHTITEPEAVTVTLTLAA